MWRILLSFYWLFFNFFLLRVDMSIWQLFDSMFLKNEGKYNELCFLPPHNVSIIKHFFLINEIYCNNLQRLSFVMTIILNQTDEYYNFYNFLKLTNLKKLLILNTCFPPPCIYLNFYLKVKSKNTLLKRTVLGLWI